MASHTTDGNPRPMAPPEPPVASAHDGAIILSLVGGQHSRPSTVEATNTAAGPARSTTATNAPTAGVNNTDPASSDSAAYTTAAPN